MKKVILDTNFLMLPGQHMVDVFSGVEEAMDTPFVIVVLDKTINELEKLAAGKGKEGQAAKLGLAILQVRKDTNPTFWQKLIGLVPEGKPHLKIIHTGAGYVDDAILRLADEDTIVATQDSALKKRLKKAKIPILTLKGKKRVGFG